MSKLSLLLDTHVILWAAKEPEKLSKPLLQALEAATNVFVSHVSAWEIQIKNLKYGRTFGFPLTAFEETVKRSSWKQISIEYADIAGMDRLNFVHPDPFDRILISQAARRGLYLTTLDRAIVSTFQAGRQFPIFTDHPQDADGKSK